MEELAKISSFTFASSLYFWAGSAAILFLIFFPLPKSRKNIRWDKGYWLKKLPGLKTRRFIIPLILITAVSVVVASALAGPQNTKKETISFEENPIMILIDISGSVGPAVDEDGPPSPFSRAKNIYFDISDKIAGAAVGLSLYSDQFYIARDFAGKREYLSDTIENKKEINEISGATMTAGALHDLRKFFSQKIPTKNKTIILISDLRDNLDSVSYEITQTLKAGINLYVIAVSDDMDFTRKIIEDLKNKIGGSKVAIVWFEDKNGINKIYEEINKMGKSYAGEAEIFSKKSLMPLILISIMGLVILLAVLSETVFRKIP